MTTDTKAAWKRRALRAEDECRRIRMVLETENGVLMQTMREANALSVAIGEIEEAISAAREYIGPARITP